MTEILPDSGSRSLWQLPLEMGSTPPMQMPMSSGATTIFSEENDESIFQSENLPIGSLPYTAVTVLIISSEIKLQDIV